MCPYNFQMPHPCELFSAPSDFNFPINSDLSPHFVPSPHPVYIRILTTINSAVPSLAYFLFSPSSSLLCLGFTCSYPRLSGKFLHLFFFFFFCFCFCFLGPHLRHMKFPRYRSNWSCNCQPTLQPQQWKIRAVSATYTTAHSNARSPTH